MIEINLLPGTGKKKTKRSGGGASFNLGASLASLSQKVKDKYLAAAFIALILGGGAVGATFTYQTHAEESLGARIDEAVQDSTHFAAVMRDKERAEAKRDTALRQLNVIRKIDEDRYVWPHVLDEISKALPPYTWLTVVNYAGTPQGVLNGALPGSLTPPVPPRTDTTKAKGKDKKTSTIAEIPRDTVKVRILGRTVDIQALTRFMKQLEASPFLGDVQLQKSELAIDDLKEVTQFTLDVTFTWPDSSVVKRVPLVVSTR
jgi:Tfp pilus assembly protein PilN